ncbi:nitrite/sulfite reductase [uncultured Megasphaera sp.]|uniref:nitrite/sulfite reductase n=1 Tax=uncultured Megasphaera sp. TaxID=165188 RepID=UPI002596A58F|nr:nitrite/sulfite reductase [uncultured Megasphaera sp.]
MTLINRKMKDLLLQLVPKYRQLSDDFFSGRISPIQYMGASGSFGSYAERGGQTAMLRLRFIAGAISHDQLAYLADCIETHAIQKIHFTSGQALQFHHLSGPEVLDIYAEALEHDVFGTASGGSHFSSIAADPLRGIDPAETFDISPYVRAAAAYRLAVFPTLRLPRKFKIAFTASRRNETHATFKDLGFVWDGNGGFDVYAAGGLGPRPQMGLCLARHTEPSQCLYYLDAMLQLFSEHGNYEAHARARSRYLLLTLGEEEFRRLFTEYLEKAWEKELDIMPEPGVAAPGAMPPVVQADSRIQPQKQDGLYYIHYQLRGGLPKKEVFTALLRYLATCPEAAGRLGMDSSFYAINLRPDEAARALAIIAGDTAKDDFHASVACIGATTCQMGIRDAQACLTALLQALDADDVATRYLPQLHISGCHFSCGGHQAGSIGLRGALKIVDKHPYPAYVVSAGGSSRLGQEAFGEEIATLKEEDLPRFFTALAAVLEEAGQPFRDWYPAHQKHLAALVQTFE